MKLLPSIQHPIDLKGLSLDALNALAQEIRSYIIDVMSLNGGHLASNLGSIELIIALHSVFSSPKDKFIFDTSHQTYAHKIITGRQTLFRKIRQFQGLSGFANPKESPHDLFYAGHAGTGLSLALGMVQARDLTGGEEHVLPIISDAPFACGLTLEALNHVSKKLKKFILVLNDNAMAISEGVGTIHNEILRPHAKEFFEPFHFDYYGPIDGHNIEALIKGLEAVKDSPHPILFHAITVKGYGMEKAVEDPVGYHGVKPVHASSPSTTFPKIFGKELLRMVEADASIVTITPAMASGSCIDPVMQKYPERSFDVGIAEGHAVTFAGGLAKNRDLKVICSIYATFLQRALDNLFQDVVLQELPVVFAIDRGGLSPSDGTTHHGIYDIGFLYAMPGMVIAQPRDGDLLRDLMHSAFVWNSPVAIRYPNMPTTKTSSEPLIRPLGKGEILVQGTGIALIALGHMCDLALEVRDILSKHGLNATVVDPIFVKPFDTQLLYELMLSHDLFVTLEEHSIMNGLGMVVNAHCPDALNFGLPDRFIEQGSYEELMNEAGLTAETIANTILERCACEEHRHLSQQLETTCS